MHWLLEREVPLRCRKESIELGVVTCCCRPIVSVLIVFWKYDSSPSINSMTSVGKTNSSPISQVSSLTKENADSISER